MARICIHIRYRISWRRYPSQVLCFVELMNQRATSKDEKIAFCDISQSASRLPTSTYASKVLCDSDRFCWCLAAGGGQVFLWQVVPTILPGTKLWWVDGMRLALGPVHIQSDSGFMFFSFGIWCDMLYVLDICWCSNSWGIELLGLQGLDWNIFHKDVLGTMSQHQIADLAGNMSAS